MKTFRVEDKIEGTMNIDLPTVEGLYSSRRIKKIAALEIGQKIDISSYAISARGKKYQEKGMTFITRLS